MTGCRLVRSSSLVVASLIARALRLAAAPAPATPQQQPDGAPTRRAVGGAWRSRRRDAVQWPGRPGAAAVARIPIQGDRVDTTGYSAATTSDGEGRWKVKIGRRSPARDRRVAAALGDRLSPAGRCTRLDLARKGDPGRDQARRAFACSRIKTESDWSWHENPFVGTRELKGLLVANLILNNWDLKASKTASTWSIRPPAPARRFVVQDLGAALGKTGWPTGNRNDIEDFEEQGLINGVEDGIVEFDYHARHKELFKDITPADVVWVCRLLPPHRPAMGGRLPGGGLSADARRALHRQAEVEGPGRPRARPRARIKP